MYGMQSAFISLCAVGLLYKPIHPFQYVDTEIIAQQGTKQHLFSYDQEMCIVSIASHIHHAKD